MKKKKKHELILAELESKRKRNDKYCDLNDCQPTSYMNGSNKILDEMIKFVKELK